MKTTASDSQLPEPGKRRPLRPYRRPEVETEAAPPARQSASASALLPSDVPQPPRLPSTRAMLATDSSASGGRKPIVASKTPKPIIDPAAAQPSPPTPIESPPAIRLSANEFVRRIHANEPQASQAAEDRQISLQRSAPAPTRRAGSLRTKASKPGSAEWTMPVRLWNAMPLSIVLSLGLFAFTWIVAENLSAQLELTGLAAKLDAAIADPSKADRLAESLASRTDSPLSRFDARRDYTVARALAAIEQGNHKSTATRQRPENAQAVYHNVARAAQRSPANPWYKLSRALLGDRFELGAEERALNWQKVEALAANPAAPAQVAEANYWRRWADHLWSLTTTQDAVTPAPKGDVDAALVAYRRFLEAKPSATGELLRFLTQGRMSPKDQLKAIPDARIALAQAVEYFKELGSTEWRLLAERTLALAPLPERGGLAEERAAEAMVALALGQMDRAASLFKDAIAARPEQLEWKQRLAQIHYDRRDYLEAARLADAIVKADPGGESAAAARALRERIGLAAGSASLGRAN